LESQVRAALGDSPSTRRSQVQVTVNNGVATITGSVDTLWLKAQVQRVVLEVSGVTAARNHVKVIPPKPVPDSAIANAILDALKRSDSIDDKAVEVAVEGGTVTLSGSVASESASQIAYNFALNTVGVKELRNNLVVDAH
jgi:hyperosmotically inducible protein